MRLAEETRTWFVYIAELADGRFYVGYTNDLHRREAEHRAGKAAARTTQLFGFTRIAYHECFADKAAASARERQLKRWSHAKKLALIAGDAAALKSLAKRHNRASTQT